MDAIRKEGIAPAFEKALLGLSRDVRRVYLHVDLNVLDVSQARVNHYACTGGLTLG